MIGSGSFDDVYELSHGNQLSVEMKYHAVSFFMQFIIHNNSRTVHTRRSYVLLLLMITITLSLYARRQSLHIISILMLLPFLLFTFCFLPSLSHFYFYFSSTIFRLSSPFYKPRCPGLRVPKRPASGLHSSNAARLVFLRSPQVCLHASCYL